MFDDFTIENEVKSIGLTKAFAFKWMENVQMNLILQDTKERMILLAFQFILINKGTPHIYLSK